MGLARTPLLPEITIGLSINRGYFIRSSSISVSFNVLRLETFFHSDSFSRTISLGLSAILFNTS